MYVYLGVIVALNGWVDMTGSRKAIIAHECFQCICPSVIQDD